MTFRATPLWLLLDPVAYVRLVLSLLAYLAIFPAICSRAVWVVSRKGIRWEKFLDDDLVALTTALAVFESDLEWAIARQARRLLGLSDNIPRNVISRATTQNAWHARIMRKMPRFCVIDKAARKLAWRMAKAGAVKSAALSTQ